jgi:protein PhnA
MVLSTGLKERSNGVCELCNQSAELETYIVPPKVGEDLSEQLALCVSCMDQIHNPEATDPEYWRCLNETMWSEIPAAQVMTYRLLNRISVNDWAQDLLNMMYLYEAAMEWAESGLGQADSTSQHRDSNGQVLQAGDTVVLIKDLDVKGANFTAKRGTSVRRISLVTDNPEQIEGKVNDQHIVILTKFVKKS